MASPFLKRTALLAALTTCATVAAMAVVVATECQC